MTWVLAVLSVAGNEFVIRKMRLGFVVWLVANTGFAVHCWLIGEYALAALYAVYWGMAARGFIRWTKEDARPSTSSGPSGRRPVYDPNARKPWQPWEMN